MFFDRHFFLLLLKILLLASLLDLTACGFLKGRGRSKEEISVLDGEMSCVKNIPVHFQSYLEGQNANENVASAFDCMDRSLGSFSKFVKGEKPGVYQAKELQDFFNEYLLKENQIESSFLTGLMKLKVGFVGGSSTEVSVEELQKSKEIFYLLQTQMQKLSPHLPILLFRKPKESVGDQDIEQALTTLEQCLREIFSKSKVQEGQYDFVDGKQLLIDFHHFISGETNPSGLTTLVKWLPGLESVKLLFWGDSAQLIQREEMDKALKQVTSIYRVGLRFYFEKPDLRLSDVTQVARLGRYIDEILSLFETSPTSAKNKVLPWESIDLVLKELHSLGYLRFQVNGEVISLDLIQNSYKKFVAHIIDRQADEDRFFSTTRGIESRHLTFLRNEYKHWWAIQSQINQYLPAQQSEVTFSTFQKEKTSLNNRQKLYLQSKDPSGSQRAWVDFQQSYNVSHPVLLTQTLQLQFPSDASKAMVSYHGMTMFHQLRTLSRFFFWGYGDMGSDHQLPSEMTVESFTNLEKDFHDLGVAIGFLDRRSKGAAARSVVEANLFTFSGNGDHLLSYQESTEIFTFMLSGGRSVAQQVYLGLENAQCVTDHLDVFQHRTVPAACLRTYFKNHFSEIFQSLPGLQEEARSWTPQLWSDFFQKLEHVAVAPERLAFQVYDFGDLRAMTTVLYYVESLFLQFDQDKDGTLNADEVRLASKKFRQFVRDKVDISSPYVAQEAFTCAVFDRRFPQGWEKIWFLFKCAGKKVFGVDPVRRTDILEMMSVLKSANAKEE
jgi:hypothetical protein